ncbi:unnamed protein product [Staurois parvus]|uniref:Uncharacterized protein n=1 Tax=Staurois parvus TaxID=386267 RepID=A0ABN9BPE7_9NEOB|nr:unnamed protein product [Staurois parvus]
MVTHQRDVPVLCIPGDSTQEGHTIPHHHQVDGSSHVNIKEEIKEEDDEDGVMEESEYPKEHKDPYQDTMEPTREMSPSSVFPGFHTGRSYHPSPLQG